MENNAAQGKHSSDPRPAGFQKARLADQFGKCRTDASLDTVRLYIFSGTSFTTANGTLPFVYATKLVINSAAQF